MNEQIDDHGLESYETFIMEQRDIEKEARSEQQEWAKAYGPNDDCLQIEGMAFQVNTSAKAVADKINAALFAERQRREQAERRATQFDSVNAELRQQLLSAQAAIEKIKQSVCGDKRPNWTNDWQTTHTRGWIADVCDSVDLSVLLRHDAEVATDAVNNFTTHTHNPIVAQLNKQIAEVRKPLLDAGCRLRELTRSYEERWGKDHTKDFHDLIERIDALAKMKEVK